MKKSNLGSLRRRFTSLLTALTFLVLAVTGVLAFLRPFSLSLVGLHALVGFLFIVLIGLHVTNNLRPLKGYLHSRSIWVALGLTVLLSTVTWLRPAPIRALMGLSANLGPAQERFEMGEEEMVFNYAPDPGYRMRLVVKTGSAYEVANPPRVAIWLENQGAYHIKTLLMPDPENARSLPYWSFKRAGWKKAKEEAEVEADAKADAGDEEELDAVSGATPNGSFDPADYILPADAKNPMPYQLLIEIDEADDGQPSLVYAVTIDNADPRTFQLLEIVGFPVLEDGDDGEDEWALFYVDDRFTTALELIDSALLQIDRR